MLRALLESPEPEAEKSLQLEIGFLEILFSKRALEAAQSRCLSIRLIGLAANRREWPVNKRNKRFRCIIMWLIECY